jgi:3-hydroxyacyl-[acyl-carrier-protein] dehydratase
MSDCFTHDFVIAADHPCFEGHFPEFPVFPAVAQLSLLAEAISLFQGKRCWIDSLPSAKFLRPISPETTVTVELRSKGENCADFTIRCAQGAVAKGKLTYRILGS